MNAPRSLLIGLLLAGAGGCYLAVFCLGIFMWMKANKRLPEDRQIPLLLHAKKWSRAEEEYRRLYPGSQVYAFTLSCAVVTLALAVGIAVVRFWELAIGK